MGERGGTSVDGRVSRLGLLGRGIEELYPTTLHCTTLRYATLHHNTLHYITFQ